ncbi:hypothetical protein [Streptomyces sp. 7N604]|uniref:hypothetical protein n=1 Tax=Streptomyces sp. 7N604 TaxID=3457415 RepID=UPI003FD5B3A4
MTSTSHSCLSTAAPSICRRRGQNLVVAHFHYTLFGNVVYAMFAGFHPAIRTGCGEASARDTLRAELDGSSPPDHVHLGMAEEPEEVLPEPTSPSSSSSTGWAPRDATPVRGLPRRRPGTTSLMMPKNGKARALC